MSKFKFEPGPRIPLSPDIIVNANAPIIEIKILLDCRFQPAKLQLMAPSNMPESVVMKALNDAIGNLLVRQIAKDMNPAMQMQNAAQAPDLPPAP